MARAYPARNRARSTAPAALRRMAIVERAAGVKRAFAAFPGQDQACKNALLLKQCYGDHPLREPGEGLLSPTIRPGCGTPSFHAGFYFPPLCGLSYWRAPDIAAHFGPKSCTFRTECRFRRPLGFSVDRTVVHRAYGERPRVVEAATARRCNALRRSEGLHEASPRAPHRGSQTGVLAKETADESAPGRICPSSGVGRDAWGPARADPTARGVTPAHRRRGSSRGRRLAREGLKRRATEPRL